MEGSPRKLYAVPSTFTYPAQPTIYRGAETSVERMNYESETCDVLGQSRMLAMLRSVRFLHLEQATPKDMVFEQQVELQQG